MSVASQKREESSKAAMEMSVLSQKKEESSKAAMEMQAPTRVMIAVSQSTMKGYPHASISSTRAFRWTLQKIIRNNTAGFKLLFLHVQRELSEEIEFADMEYKYASPEDFMIVKNKEKKRGLHLLEGFVNECHEVGVACEAWTRTGNPQETICREVKRIEPDFLVVGCRGLGPFQRVFVGTVSEFCVKHAECPVIAIKRLTEEIPEDPADD